jgi:hypothetical protein
MKLSNVLRVGLAVSLCGLAGCGWFSRERKEVYQEAQQGKALEIPPELDSPARRSVMQVPPGPVSQEGISEKPVSDVQAGAADITEQLFIDASPGEAFERVRDALEQAQIGTLGAIDADRRTITITVEIETIEPRWLRKDKVNRRQLLRVVRVVADGAKSRVLVADGNGNDVDDEGSKKVLLAVRERVLD